MSTYNNFVVVVVLQILYMSPPPECCEKNWSFEVCVLFGTSIALSSMSNAELMGAGNGAVSDLTLGDLFA